MGNGQLQIVATAAITTFSTTTTTTTFSTPSAFTDSILTDSMRGAVCFLEYDSEIARNGMID